MALLVYTCRVASAIGCYLVYHGLWHLPATLVATGVVVACVYDIALNPPQDAVVRLRSWRRS